MRALLWRLFLLALGPGIRPDRRAFCASAAPVAGIGGEHLGGQDHDEPSNAQLRGSQSVTGSSSPNIEHRLSQNAVPGSWDERMEPCSEDLKALVGDGSALVADVTQEQGLTALKSGDVDLAVHPSHDAFVQGGDAKDANFGREMILSVKNDVEKNERLALLRFEGLPRFSPAVTPVLLRLFVTGMVGPHDATEVTIFRLSKTEDHGTTWDEYTVSKGNLFDRAIVEKEGVTFAVSKSDIKKWVEVDISNLLPDADSHNGVLNLMLEGAAGTKGNVLSVASRENPGHEPMIYGLAVQSVADSFIQGEIHQNDNYGSEQELWVKKDIERYTRIDLLRFYFQVPKFYPLLPPYTPVKLGLYVIRVGEDSARDITVSRLKPGVNWDEDSVAWSNIDPHLVDKVGNTFTVTKDDVLKWVYVDVTNLLTEGEMNLVLENLGAQSVGSAVVFGSRKNRGHEPHLLLEKGTTVELRAGTNYQFCVTVPQEGKTIDGTSVELSKCRRGKSQKWIIDGYGYIRSNLDRSMCLTLPSIAYAARVEVSLCKNSANQRWSFTSKKEIRSELDTEKCFDLAGGGKSTAYSGQKILGWNCHNGWRGAKNQMWTLKDV